MFEGTIPIDIGNHMPGGLWFLGFGTGSSKQMRFSSSRALASVPLFQVFPVPSPVLACPA